MKENVEKILIIVGTVCVVLLCLSLIFSLIIPLLAIIGLITLVMFFLTYQNKRKK